MWFFMTLICSSICSFFLSVCERTTRRCATPRAQMPNKSNPFTSMEMFRQSISIQVVIKITKQNLNPTCLLRYIFRLSSENMSCFILFSIQQNNIIRHPYPSLPQDPSLPSSSLDEASAQRAIFRGAAAATTGRSCHPAGLLQYLKVHPRISKNSPKPIKIHLKNELRFWKRQTNKQLRCSS